MPEGVFEATFADIAIVFSTLVISAINVDQIGNNSAQSIRLGLAAKCKSVDLPSSQDQSSNDRNSGVTFTLEELMYLNVCLAHGVAESIVGLPNGHTGHGSLRRALAFQGKILQAISEADSRKSCE